MHAKYNEVHNARTETNYNTSGDGHRDDEKFAMANLRNDMLCA